jgi:hypothetical protein
MKLCLQLLRLSGDSVYADCMEQTFYNAYFAAMNTNLIPKVEIDTNKNSVKMVLPLTAIHLFAPADMELKRRT